VKDALEFRNIFGDKEIMQYMSDLSWQAGNEVQKIWGTEMLINDKSRLSSLNNIRIPCNDMAKVSQIVQEMI